MTEKMKSDEMASMTFGEKLKKIRMDKKLTQRMLADATGISVSSIRKYEERERAPKPAQVEKLAEVLGVSDTVFSSYNIKSIEDVKKVIREIRMLFGIRLVAGPEYDVEIENKIQIYKEKLEKLERIKEKPVLEVEDLVELEHI